MKEKKAPASKFLDEYFRSGSSDRRLSPESKYTVRHDKYDNEDYRGILQEMKELDVAEDKLSDAVDTGSEAMADTFFSILKANPKLKEEDDVRPSFMVNRIVMDELMDLQDWEALRTYSTNDIVASGLACIAMEPDLEVLFDKLKEEQKLSQEFEDMLNQMDGMAGSLASTEEMMEQALAEGNEDEAQDFQKQAEKIKEQMQELREKMQQKAKEIDDKIHGKGKEIKDIAKKALGNAKDKAESLDSLSSSWGLDPGELLRLPAQRRIELAQKFNNEKFNRIAKLIGPMSRVAIAEQMKKVNYARDEIYDIEMGSDISNILPIELLNLADDDTAMLFFKKLVERKLLQYKLRGTEKIAKGGIIWVEDGSGSMAGDNEVWAKAVGLALYRIAQFQKRYFYAMHFGSPGEIMTFDFHKETSEGVDIELYGEPYRVSASDTGHYDNIDGVIKFAETFFCSGTDFVTPLSKALDVLIEQNRNEGAVKADIVFCTDGLCGVPEEWLNMFIEERDRLGFKVWGILIGYAANVNTEPLNTICNGRILTLKDLLHDSARNIFADI